VGASQSLSKYTHTQETLHWILALSDSRCGS
jgi:cytochrome b561